jgi:hypothetical protein
MAVVYRSNERKLIALAAGALLLASLSLGGCASSTAGSSLMNARAETLVAPKASNYPSVGDLPTTRAMPAMTAGERSKLAKDLIAARDHQAGASKARGATPQAQPVKP